MKTVMFDFDGTLADTLSLVLEIANEVLPEFKHPKLTDEEVEVLRGMTLRQGLAHLKIPSRLFPQLALRSKQKLGARIDRLEPIKGIEDTLKVLKKADMRLAIVTSNSKSNVMTFLDAQNLTQYFDFIDCGVSIFGKHRRIKHAMRLHRIDPKQAMYVGDEIRDIEAAKAVGIGVVSVSWGINSRTILEAYHPTAIVDTPKQLADVLTSGTTA